MGKVGAGLQDNNETKFNQIVIKSLHTAYRLLVIIGSPIFYFLYYTLYLLSIIGLFTRKTLELVLIFLHKNFPKAKEEKNIKYRKFLYPISDVNFPLSKSRELILVKINGKFLDIKKSFKFLLFDIATYSDKSIIKTKNLLKKPNLQIAPKKTLIFEKQTNPFIRLYKYIAELLRRKENLSALITHSQKSYKSYSRQISSLIYSCNKVFYSINSRARHFLYLIKLSYYKSLSKFYQNISLALIKLRLKKTRTRTYKKNKNRIRAKFAFYLSIIFIILSIPVLAFFIFLQRLPSVDELIERKQEISTKIYDRNSYLLYKIYKDENRTIIPLEEVPYHAILSTLAAEDAEFYTHPGISFRGIIRSVIRNTKRNELAGGSTITQQLIKNTLLTPEKTFVRKAKEVVLAIQVERKFSKDQILEMYLNEVSYGGTAYGIQEAARLYFDKNAKDLTLAEAALLASLPKSPTKYSPFGVNPELALDRQKTVLHLMEINGFISKEERLAAEQEKIVFAQNNIEIRAPHFVMYTRDILEQEYGRETVETGGLEVITTLDYEIQKMAEQVVKEEVDNLKRFNVGNAAVVVMDPKTGEILAMVGSTDYFNSQNDGNVNAAIALRQPGSSIKLVNYAYALSNGFTPATILEDTPVTYSIPGQPPYTPKNYDDTFRGKISLRSALAESRNIPAVKILNSYGVGKMIDLGSKMGITTWNERNRFGLSLTLGGGEVKLVELAQVYSTVANYGVKPQLTAVRKITNYQGNILEENRCIYQDIESKFKFVERLTVSAAQVDTLPTGNNYICRGERALDERVAFLLTDILRDGEARSPAFGSHSQLVIRDHEEVAVKTGTSNNLRDNLTVGYNQDYVVAVWVGNNDNTPMSRVASGITGASTIFNKIMTNLLEDKPSIAWNVPSGLVTLPTCKYTGTLPCDGCPTKNEWFLEENTPIYACRSDTIEAVDRKKEERSG